MGFLEKMAAAFRDFMVGRRGIDELGIVLFIGGIILTFLSSITGLSIFYWVGTIVFIYALWRALSKDINKRALENEAFQRKNKQAKHDKDFAKKKWENRKTTGYVVCSRCEARLSYPKGKGKLRITCPKCKNVFEVDSGK